MSDEENTYDTQSSRYAQLAICIESNNCLKSFEFITDSQPFLTGCPQHKNYVQIHGQIALKGRYPEELTNPQSWCVGIAHRMQSWRRAGAFHSCCAQGMQIARSSRSGDWGRWKCPWKGGCPPHLQVQNTLGLKVGLTFMNPIASPFPPNTSYFSR